MYEVWLMLNIVWELLLGYAPWAIAGALALTLLWLLAAIRRRAAWGRGFAVAFAAGLLATAAAVYYVPAYTGAAFSEMAYWIDWLMLFAVAGAAGAIVAALVWPAAALFLRTRG